MMTQPRLNKANLTQAKAALGQPSSVGKRSDNKIVHIGIGAFSRAHQALYTQIANDKTQDYWSIVGVSLRSPGVRDTLKPQDYLYTIKERSLNEDNLRCISCLEDILVGSENAQAVIDQIADESTKIVTVTVTEKGYCQKNQRLDTSNSAVTADIESGSCTSLPAYLARALLARKEAGLAGITIVSCDNLPNNGEILQNVVTDFADTLQAELRNWIDDNVRFCSTMVDRIVPAATEQLVQEISTDIGLYDAGALLCEPYKQWVIEDNFLSSRPAWEEAGALLVKDVAAYEKLKLRMLNGCHSALAYIGSLLGDEFIHQTIARPEVEAFIARLMGSEQSKSLQVPSDIDIEQYSGAVIERFKNKYVPYRNAQVATDGSLKLPQRLLFSANDLREKNITPHCIALAVAAWLQCLVGFAAGGSYSVSDPNLERLEAIITPHLQDSTALVSAMMSQSGIFPESLQKDEVFESLVLECFQSLQTLGVAEVLANVTAR
ncbi:mannitol dehydrogenase family protein [Gilvimarinus agarilyticus]|uniref:mannitol dehydrogenase family protein n=1 Tax=Gilvimarinus sp. 2_MG-2023 TaxID=3062666 RepID=UPI001C099BD8|nr:mannitol dehydrogenase family protein [Gilvimarinus sp. 2_MG-2023]MBU2886707.1 mannitol dehydrogenase family protein [Gilvimarinus agarilyticus]MDO6571373.1 mannitol dehydrogenase family protein [Gilvimarinus sp. 2_MG-2023]